MTSSHCIRSMTVPRPVQVSAKLELWRVSACGRRLIIPQWSGKERRLKLALDEDSEGQLPYSLLLPERARILLRMMQNVRRHTFRCHISALLLCVVAVTSGCNLVRITSTPLPTPDLPRVEILRPAANQQVIEGTDFDIDILAVDHSKGIRRVELYVDDFLLNESETAAFQSEYLVTMNWYASGLGWHTFTALAYRADGTSSTAYEIRLQVIPSN